MHEGSAASRLFALDVGQRFYIDTTAATYANDMRVALVPRSRRHPDLAGREFKAQVLTAVGFSVGDVRYLICIERIA